MDNIKKYNKIRKVISNNPKRIDTFVPSPSETDYNKGYITRFFIQQTNDINSPIYEVSSLNFRRYSSSKRLQRSKFKMENQRTYFCGIQ